MDPLLLASAASQEKDDLCLQMCRRCIMEAGLLMLLTFRVGDDGLPLHAVATGDGHTTAGSCFDSSVSPLRCLLCVGTRRRFLSRCGRLSSSCSLRSSWGDGERTSKAISPRDIQWDITRLRAAHACSLSVLVGTHSM
ncbi:uncharacterized protein LOC124690435 [Lolium rigidum]|uniref:uncharacterized protein LOC124690435 n=1 Tax=Lolium rigidum TaxID=89674 RepID=UPI001F5DA3DD|nr:uncharacterized protein LOC124690435 [Lolium rigidum]